VVAGVVQRDLWKFRRLRRAASAADLMLAT
jgi:hypothetical protein